MSISIRQGATPAKRERGFSRDDGTRIVLCWRAENRHLMMVRRYDGGGLLFRPVVELQEFSPVKVMTGRSMCAWSRTSLQGESDVVPVPMALQEKAPGTLAVPMSPKVPPASSQALTIPLYLWRQRSLRKKPASFRHNFREAWRLIPPTLFLLTGLRSFHKHLLI